jgi:hypothetical protein
MPAKMAIRAVINGKMISALIVNCMRIPPISTLNFMTFTPFYTKET